MADDGFSYGGWMDYLNSMNREHRQKEEQFRRLCAEPCLKVPKPGDKVIIAAGLIGRGFDWVRTEVEVLAVADTSVKIRHKPYRADQPGDEEWIHPALITDVLEAQS